MSITPKDAAEQLVRSFKDNVARKHTARLRKHNPATLTPILQHPFLRSPLGLYKVLDQCELPDYKEEALAVLDFEQIYAGVDKRTEEQERQKRDGTLEGPEYGYSDFIVMEVLKWYKNSFFEWFSTPKIPGKTGERLVGAARPTPEEAAGWASMVEVYQYDDGTTYRFPRYNDPKKLLKTRKGRCGEWNNCFYLFMRALDINVRSVWNAEDHVWCEVYSTKLGRWIHVDSCEEAFDKPDLYNKGWGKKMSYCIAVHQRGLTDVSRRYVVDEEKALPRNKIGEVELKKALTILSDSRKRGLHIDELWVLDVLEYFDELDLAGKLNHATGSGPALPRQTGAGSWTELRGEAGV